MNMKYVFLLIIALSLFSCVTKKDDVIEEKSFDLYLLKAQDATKNGKYQKAIEILNETIKEFPQGDIITIYYNIGFNYYKLLKSTEAKKYFDRVINLFEEGNFVPDQLTEYRKFVILSEIIIEKMQEDEQARKDPYHIKEDLNKTKKIKPLK